MNHCVGKVLLGLFSLLPVLVVGGCDSSTSPSAEQTGGASGGTPETGGAPGMAGHTAASSVATGGANPETGGAPGMAGNTGAAGAAAGASSAGEIASAGATDLAGAMAGATGSGGKSAGGTSAGGKTGSAGATGSSGGVIGSGGATNLAGATASGGVMGSGGAAGKTTGGSAAAGNTGSAGATATGGSKPAGGTTTNGGTKATGGTTATGGATATGGTTVVINPGQCDATTTPVARHGKLRIENGKLVNQCGRPIQLASMSMYDWSQQGRQFYNADAVKNLAGTGTGQKSCPSLRVPLLASNYPSQYARMKTVMDACIANGIYCIPNWHVIGNAVVANAKAFYVQLANDYGNTPNIIYEPWNEPTTATWPTIKAYMEEIIAAVRPIDPDNIFLSGTRQWDQRPDEACANPITSTTNVGYVFHFYANSHTLAGFQGNLTKCLNANQLIWATEYGGVSSSGNGTFNVTEVNKWWDYLDQNLISSNNWAVETNGETSSVFVKTASATGPWDDSQITDSGKNVFPYIAKRYPILMSQ